MGKESMLMSTDASLSVALLYALLTGVEYLSEDEDFPLESVSYSWGLEEELAEYPYRVLERGVIEVYSSRLYSSVERVMDVGDYRVTVRVSPGYGDYGIRRLYEKPYLFLRGDYSRIRERALITSRTGTEYMFVYLSNGELAVFEGETFRVRLPFIEAVANIHTHPEGACGLSRPDVESGLDLLSRGGLLAAAATPSCMAFMVRVGLVSEDDYIRVRELLLSGRLRELWASRFSSLIFGFTSY